MKDSGVFDGLGKRRLLRHAACGALVGLGPLAWAQARPAIPRIGILTFGAASAASEREPAEGVLLGLRELGYVEGRNILIERRYAQGQPERIAGLVAELVQMKVDVILAGGPAMLEAASKATGSIPIVAVSGSDPVREGWARSLARPGGNVTGLTVTFPELGKKRLELLKEAIPGLARVAVLIAPDEVAEAAEALAEMQTGAKQLAMQLQILEVRGPADFDAAFATARKGRAQALVAVATNLMVIHRSRLAELASQYRLPSISGFPLMAQAGFLMAYGADLNELGRRSILFMDKILKGARAGDLPIERPAKFQLTVNLQTVKTLGIKIPQSLLLRADEVIQ